MAPIRIRPVEDADIPAIWAIYDHYVRLTSASWGLAAPSLEEFARDAATRRAKGFPFLVAEPIAADGACISQIAAYSYAASFRSRAGYRYAVEDSVYVAPGWQRRGVGEALLRALIEACSACGFRQMIAVVTADESVDDAGVKRNAGAPSIALHEKCGFRIVGRLPSIGFKFGRWMDAVFMQCQLGEGDSSVPEEASLPDGVREARDPRRDPEATGV